VPRRTLEEAGKRKGELDNPHRSEKLWLMDAERADEGTREERTMMHLQ
jgi:hypothetical protein